MTADQAWLELIQRIVRDGKHTKPRGLTCKEIIGHQTVVDMNYPITTLRPKLGYRFLAAEAWWILSGKNDVASIAPYSRHIADFSDNGQMFFGAYGPKITEQLSYVAESIINDPWSRQAVIDIWRPNPPKSRDIPCTLSTQFLLRPHVDSIGVESLRLHCIDTMRSSDAWLGWPYDVFNFSMLSACLALAIGLRTKKRITLGELHLTAGSQHLYVHPKEDGNTSIPYKIADVLNVLSGVTYNPIFYSPIDLSDFKEPQCLINHLGLCKDFKGILPFLKEFQK